MGYVSTEIFGSTYEFLEADVLDCQRFFGCSFEDALYHLAYPLWLEEGHTYEELLDHSEG